MTDGLKKGPWTPEEDQTLLAYIAQHGHGCWPSLPAKAGLQRSGKSCRLRWTNYLRPDIKFSLLEEETIVRLHALLGNWWSAIATHLPNRRGNEIKNYWNTHLKKRMDKMGIDPVTHRPRSDDALGTAGAGGAGTSAAAAGAQHAVAAATAHFNHTALWESARLEAQARMARTREASRQSALAASASVSARRRRCPDTPPTSMLSYYVSRCPDTRASVREQLLHELHMASSSSAPLQTTVSMSPAPEASSSSASLPTSSVTCYARA